MRRQAAELVAGGLTHVQAAERLGISQISVYRIVTGRSKPAGDKGSLGKMRAARLKATRDERRQAKAEAERLGAELKGQARRDAKDGWSLPAGKRGLLADLLVRIEAFPAGDPDIERAMAPVLKALAAVRRRFWPASDE